MNQKIIIDARGVPIDKATRHVTHVINGGRISDNSKAYCFITTWMDGTVVQAIRNDKSDRFIVTDESPK